MNLVEGGAEKNDQFSAFLKADVGSAVHEVVGQPVGDGSERSHGARDDDYPQYGKGSTGEGSREMVHPDQASGRRLVRFRDGSQLNLLGEPAGAGGYDVRGDCRGGSGNAVDQRSCMKGLAGPRDGNQPGHTRACSMEGSSSRSRCVIEGERLGGRGPIVHHGANGLEESLRVLALEDVAADGDAVDSGIEDLSQPLEEDFGAV